MKYAGIWPEERKWNRSSSYIVLLPILSMLCFVCGPQTMNLPRIRHDLNLVVENLSTANVTLTLSLIKTVAFWKNGKCKDLIVSSYNIIYIQSIHIIVYPISSKDRIDQESLTEITEHCNFIYLHFLNII